MVCCKQSKIEKTLYSAVATYATKSANSSKRDWSVPCNCGQSLLIFLLLWLLSTSLSNFQALYAPEPKIETRRKKQKPYITETDESLVSSRFSREIRVSLSISVSKIELYDSQSQSQSRIFTKLSLSLILNLVNSILTILMSL